MNWNINIDSFTLRLAASKKLNVSRDAVSGELILSFPGPPDATRITVDEHSLTFAIGRVELRLSEEAGRQLAGSLPLN